MHSYLNITHTRRLLLSSNLWFLFELIILDPTYHLHSNVFMFEPIYNNLWKPIFFFHFSRSEAIYNNKCYIYNRKNIYLQYEVQVRIFNDFHQKITAINFRIDCIRSDLRYYSNTKCCKHREFDMVMFWRLLIFDWMHSYLNVTYTHRLLLSSNLWFLFQLIIFVPTYYLRWNVFMFEPIYNNFWKLIFFPFLIFRSYLQQQMLYLQ